MNKKVFSITDKAKLVDESPNSIVVTDLNGVIIFVNNHFQELSGYTPSEVIGKTPRLLQSGNTPPETYKEMWSTITSGGRWLGEFQNRKKDGTLYWELATIFCRRNKHGEICGYIAIKNNITRRKEAERVSQELRELQGKMERMAKIGCFSINLKSNEETWSEGVYLITDLEIPKGERPPVKGINFYTDDSKPMLRNAVKAAKLYGIPYSLKLQIVTTKGDKKWVRTSGETILENGIPVTVAGFIQDVTEQVRLEEELMTLGIIDDLTGLYNKRHFKEQLAIEIDRVPRYEKPLSMIFLDVDHFKVVNDTHGHLYGDEVLVRLAQVLKRCVRATDLIHRNGGDEFTVLLPSADLAAAIRVAEKILAEFNQEEFKTPSGEIIHLTLSLGVVEHLPKEGLDSLVRRADDNMYTAKNGGRGRVCF